jgi:DDE superfamily endonuclease
LIDEFDLLFNECLDAFTHPVIWKKARELAYGALTCMGRHTLTGMLTASGKQFMDWSSAYRLFSHQRVNTSKLFDIAQLNVLKEIEDQGLIVAHMDDTLIKKRGRFIPGAAWRRDPLGPPFHTNFIWGQRFLQISMALPQYKGDGQSRAIPVDFYHCPSVKKPNKFATQQTWEQYKEMQKEIKLSKQGSERIKLLRDSLNENDAHQKQLVMSVDGSYTNKEVLKNLPEKVTLIGRIRKDTKLYAMPDNQASTGRKRVYGERLPTPEGIRQSDQYQWQEVMAWAAGKTHKFNVKVLRDLRWKSAGEKHNLMLVVIRPLGYRLTKSSKILYREPAYLICTDTKLDIQKLLQSYLWRWEIEVNFREEKTLLGCGQAQVRNPNSAQQIPAFITAMYSLLHIANHRTSKNQCQSILPRPKWYRKKETQRITTGDLINNIRAQLWAKALGISFSSFVNKQIKLQSLKNKANPSNSAMFYLRN